MINGKKIRFMGPLIYVLPRAPNSKVMPNLCVTTTFGIRKKWLLFRGGHYLERHIEKL